MYLLALDVGTRRTGCAFCDTTVGVPLALDTIRHDSVDALEAAVLQLVDERHINRILLGNPLLPSGAIGEQAEFVHAFAERLRQRQCEVELIDERYTTPQRALADGDAQAACTLLLMWLEKRHLTKDKFKLD
jgi:putative Holliday junction resolvase